MKFVTPPKVPKRNVLLYGPPKTGKTRGATSAPGPVLLLNADLPNATWFAHSQQKRGHIKEVQYEGFNTLLEIGTMVAKGELPFETIVIDPLGELYRRLLEEFSQRAISPSLPTYQAVSVHLERFCRALCESPDFNVVLVAHEHPVHDESNNTTEKLAWTGTKNPALGQKLMGMVDIVGFTAMIEAEDGNHQYVAQLINAKGRRGGDRFDSLGDFAPLDLAAWFASGPQETKKTEADEPAIETTQEASPA